MKGVQGEGGIRGVDYEGGEVGWGGVLGCRGPGGGVVGTLRA